MIFTSITPKDNRQRLAEYLYKMAWSGVRNAQEQVESVERQEVVLAPEVNQREDHMLGTTERVQSERKGDRRLGSGVQFDNKWC